MKSPFHFHLSRTELVVILLVLGTLSWILYRAAPNGPAGRPIPTVPPDESRRRQFACGLSIVLPPDWVSSSTGQLFITPRDPRPYGGRSSALILVSPLGELKPIGLEKMSRIDFLGREAYEGMEIVRRWSLDDPAWSLYTLYTQRGKQWYEVKYGIDEERMQLPGIVRQYLETLRWERNEQERI